MTDPGVVIGTFRVIDAGLIEYEECYKLQKDLLAKRIAGTIGDTLIIAEHQPVITIGRNGSFKNLLARPEVISKAGIDIVKTDRGGDVTFHGPGQLVMYPIVDLKGYGRDIYAYIRNLEKVVLHFLSGYGITCMTIDRPTGVWLDANTKIGSIGIGISKWVGYHGISVNIDIEPRHFELIRPCGIEGCVMGSLAEAVKSPIDIGQAKRGLVEAFCTIFEKWRVANNGKSCTP